MSLAQSPDVGGPRQPMLIVDGLTKHYPIGKGWSRSVVKAVDGVSFTVAKGEALGIVGESGCGKSTTARLLMHLIPPDGGSIIFDGETVGGLRGIDLKDLRRRQQMVFQDSHASLNPRLTIEDTIAFGPRTVGGLSRRAARDEAHAMLRLVGLAPENFAQRYPHELSGGQRQRVNIARALALHPQVLILDEAVSALDKSVEAQILNLLEELKQRLSLTYLFISHDLNVVQHLCDRVIVMYLGKLVETGPIERVYDQPSHPYTQALLSSRLSTDPAKRITAPPLSGDPPSPVDPPSGCRFRTRCPIAAPICANAEPVVTELAEDHGVACHARMPGSGHPLAGALS